MNKHWGKRGGKAPLVRAGKKAALVSRVTPGLGAKCSEQDINTSIFIAGSK